MENLLKKAYEIALKAHRGQIDKVGRPYFDHVYTVSESIRYFGEDYAIVALLHDCVEDTDITLDFLKGEGFSSEVITGVDAMTRREGESWKNYIHRVKEN